MRVIDLRSADRILGRCDHRFDRSLSFTVQSVFNCEHFVVLDLISERHDQLIDPHDRTGIGDPCAATALSRDEQVRRDVVGSVDLTLVDVVGVQPSVPDHQRGDTGSSGSRV